MATLLEFCVDVDAFPFGRAFGALPDATVELERIVPTGDQVVPYLWIRGVSVGDVAEALAEAPSAGDLELVDALDSRGWLYRATWDGADDGLVGALVQAPVTLLSATCRDATWQFQLRVEDHAAVAAFERTCVDRGVPITVTRVGSLASASTDELDAHLTDPQFEALSLAFERGYFDDPRRVTLSELAAELGITRQSFPGRLRRGHRNLLATLFGTTGPNRRDQPRLTSR